MILELKFLSGNGGEVGLKPQNNGRIVIHYRTISDIEEGFECLHDLSPITTLVIWGGHGSQTQLCGLEKPELEWIVEKLSKNKLKTIVLDTCETALHAHLFVPLLDVDGVILCHIGVNPAQVLGNHEMEVVKEEDIRTMWMELIRKAIKYSPALFPAIYKNGSMNYLHVEGMTFEGEGVDNPFTQKDLDSNKEKTGAQQITQPEDFKQLL